MRIKNENIPSTNKLQVPLPSEIKLSEDSTPELTKVSILGYTGKEVDLSDYGIDAPVVYLVDGIELYKKKIPYLLNHNPNTPLGHLESFTKTNNTVVTNAVHSFPSQESKDVAEGIANGMPYEASMGLEIDVDSVVYHSEGQVKANGRVFNAPIYTVSNSKIYEMSATLFGRDDDTEITKLSKDALMKIRNTAPTKDAKNEDTKPKDDVQEDVKNETPKDTKKDDKKEVENQKKEKDSSFTNSVNNGTSEKGTVDQEALFNNRVANAVARLSEYPDNKDLVVQSIKNGWSDEKLEREVKFFNLENSYKGVPSQFSGNDKVENSFVARLALSVGIKPEFIKNKVGEKTTDHALSQGSMGLKEGLMLCANANGGSFNGHSDVQNLSKHVKRLVNQNSFSTIDFPNLMHQVTEWKMEEAWLLDAPFAPEIAMALSNKDFRGTGHLKPKGGTMWNGLNKEGKIDHGSFGEEDKYETKLNTVAQIVTFKRPDIINDDIGWIAQLLDLMVEGALMVPDYQLVNLIYNATSAGMLLASGDNQNAFTLALTAENLETVYNAAKRREVVKGDKAVKARQKTEWDLVITDGLEKTAWEIIDQESFVQGPTNTFVGKKNYWKDKFNIRIFDQLDNTTYHASAKEAAWGLVPRNAKYAPFAITYLNGMSRPTTETVDLPADELGFGVRGYWDVNMDYRPVENNRLQATAWSFPANS